VALKHSNISSVSGLNLDVSFLESGIYFVNIHDKEGEKIATSKLVVE
jgi:hypothetical protein